MSDTSGDRPRQNNGVSRRVFLHSTSVIPAALASPGLLRLTDGMTTARAPRRAGRRTLRIAAADCRRRADATVGRTGHTVDLRSRAPGRATSSRAPTRAPDGVQDDQRGVGSDRDSTRARLPLPRGRRHQPANACESRTGAARRELVEHGWRSSSSRSTTRPARPPSSAGSAVRRGCSPVRCPTKS